MASASPFTPNLTKLDWDGVGSDLTSLAKRFAATTDSPIDDLAAGYLGPILAQWLKNQFGNAASGLMKATSPEEDVVSIEASLAAQGVTASRPFLEALLKIAQSLLPIVLPLILSPAP